jgi:hypothetical protein
MVVLLLVVNADKIDIMRLMQQVKLLILMLMISEVVNSVKCL